MSPARHDFESASAAAIAADAAFAALFDGAKTPHPVTGLDDAPVLYNEADRLAFAALAQELVAEIAAQRPVRISTSEAISSPTTSMRTSCFATSGSASSRAVRNWLDTSPRTRIGWSSLTAAAPMRSGPC